MIRVMSVFIMTIIETKNKIACLYILFSYVDQNMRSNRCQTTDNEPGNFFFLSKFYHEINKLKIHLWYITYGTADSGNEILIFVNLSIPWLIIARRNHKSKVILKR